MKYVFVVLLGLTCSLGLTGGRLAAETPQEYDRALGQVQSALGNQSEALQAGVISPGQPPSLVAQQVLGPIHSIGLPGRASTLVNTGPLVAAIKAAEAVKDPDTKADTLDALARQIALLRASLQAAPVPTDPAAAAASAKAVLAGQEFASDPPPPPSLADRLAAWLDKLFQPRRRTPAAPGPNINPKIVEGILITIVAIAFAILVAVLVQAIGRRDAKTRPLALDEEEATLVEARDNESLLALADQSAKSGDYRRAFRLVYLASLVTLDTDGVLRFDRSKTNWEYLRALRASGRGDVYTALTPLTREFDQVWYGFAPTNSSQYAWAVAQYNALKDSAQAPVPAEAAAR